MRRLVQTLMTGMAISGVAMLSLAYAQPVPSFEREQDRASQVEQPRRTDPLQSSMQAPSAREPGRREQRREQAAPAPARPDPRLNYSSDEEQQPQ